MLVQSECQSSYRVPLPGFRAGQSLRRPHCPRCGSVPLFAEQSSFDLAGRIDHAWSCDNCDHAFVTSIGVLPR